MIATKLSGGPAVSIASMIRLLRTLLGVVVGYLVMVALLFLVQDVSFGGISFDKSSTLELLIAGPLSALAAVVGGVTATAIAGMKTRTAGVVMSVIVVIETIYLVTTGRVGGPLWFDLLGSGSLVAGILVGAELLLRLTRRS